MALGLKPQDKTLALKACERTVELGLLGIAGQFFSQRRWQRTIYISPDTKAKIQELLKDPKGILLLIPHTTLMEALTALPALTGLPRRTSVLYRAFKSPVLEKIILGRREKHGVRLLNRSTGVRTLIREIQAGQIGAILFDQSSGEKGSLISFMGRVAAVSDLPDIIAKHTDLNAFIFAIKRTSFWRGELVVEKLDNSKRAPSLALQAHQWLENYLKNPVTSTDWLWTHRRWKVLDRPREVLGFAGREVLQKSWSEKKTRIFVRLPNWLGDVVMALPMLRALRASRPDVHITYLSRSAYIPLLNKFPLADRFIGLPADGLPSWILCSRLSHEHPDASIALTNSIRGDIEMLVTGAKIRIGLRREGYARPLLTDGYAILRRNLETTHQSKVLEEMFKHFGLTTEVSYAPFTMNPFNRNGPIGFVPGSSNTPEKRYPAELWRDLAIKLNRPIALFGSPTEQEIGQTISHNLPLVTDFIGKTALDGLADELSKCSLIIGNDTGAIHLANALGIPTIVLYGPTSPLRTRPVFHVGVTQIKAPEGQGIETIKVDEIFERVMRG